MNRFIVTALWVVGAIFLSKGIYMDVKAEVAQWLIASSWEERSDNEIPVKPWPWADTRAIAKLEAPRLKETLYVMQDDSGESLAFGPGHMPASAPLSEEGHVVIAGHRDSHFEFLRHIKVGDLITTESYQSSKQHYQVTELFIIDSNKQQIPIHEHAQLTLITCYPFDDFIPGGPLRLIINAQPITISELAKNVSST